MKILPQETDQFDDLIHNEKTTFNDLTVFDRNGLAPISKDNLYGLIDSLGEVVVPFEYQSIVMSTYNIYSVSKNDKWGYITKANEIVIPIEYDLTSDFIENLCAVKKEGKWGFIDLLNEVVIPIDYDGCTDFKSGIAGVMKDEKWGVIDKNNELKIDYQYQYLTPVDENFISFGVESNIKVERTDILAHFPYMISKNNYIMNFGLISSKNEVLLEPISELPVLESFNGNPVVRINYQIGYLENMKNFIPFKQFEIDPYEEKILKQLGVMK